MWPSLFPSFLGHIGFRCLHRQEPRWSSDSCASISTVSGWSVRASQVLIEWVMQLARWNASRRAEKRGRNPFLIAGKSWYRVTFCFCTYDYSCRAFVFAVLIICMGDLGRRLPLFALGPFLPLTFLTFRFLLSMQHRTSGARMTHSLSLC